MPSEWAATNEKKTGNDIILNLFTQLNIQIMPVMSSIFIPCILKKKHNKKQN